MDTCTHVPWLPSLTGKSEIGLLLPFQWGGRGEYTDRIHLDIAVGVQARMHCKGHSVKHVMFAGIENRLPHGSHIHSQNSSSFPPFFPLVPPYTQPASAQPTGVFLYNFKRQWYSFRFLCYLHRFLILTLIRPNITANPKPFHWVPFEMVHSGN